MLNPDLLSLLACPETRQVLHAAEPELLERVNRTIERGVVTNRAGEAVGAALDAGLVREDGRVLYPVRDGIPIMLIDESLLLDFLET